MPFVACLCCIVNWRDKGPTKIKCTPPYQRLLIKREGTDYDFALAE